MAVAIDRHHSINRDLTDLMHVMALRIGRPQDRDRLPRKLFSMRLYRVDFFDEDGNLYGTVELNEADDDAAIQQAHRINIPSSGGWFQVLHGTRLVYTHRNPPRLRTQ